MNIFSHLSALLKCFSIFVLAAFVTACTTPIPYSEMMPTRTALYTQLDNPNLRNNVTVDKVTLSSEMPTVGLIITDAEFKKVLENSLRNAGWYSTAKKPRYTLDALFIKQDVPFNIFNVKHFSIVNYTLIDNRSKKIVYDERVTIPCVVTVGEVFDGTARHMRAMRCSVGENVMHLLRDLNSKF